MQIVLAERERFVSCHIVICLGAYAERENMRPQRIFALTITGATLLLAQTPAQTQANRALATFPAQQRPPGDPALIARGKTLYSISCQGCHGVDLRGGDLGGPNLLRSQVVLSDQDGELILPIIQGARQATGMP